MVCTGVSAQTVSFDIKVFGSNIGRMDVSRIREADGVELYTIVSNSKAKILWMTKTYHSKFEVRFKNGKMISSWHFESENEKPKRWAKVVYDGKLYRVESEKGTRSFAEAPVFSDANIYFDDCSKLKRVYYLPDADFDEVTHVDGNTIEFKSTDGHRNVYFFENGKIKGMEFHLALATVYMSRIN